MTNQRKPGDAEEQETKERDDAEVLADAFAAMASVPLAAGAAEFPAHKKRPIHHGPSSGIGHHLSSLREMSEAATAESKTSGAKPQEPSSVPSFELRDGKTVHVAHRAEHADASDLSSIASSLRSMAESQARIAAARERSLLLEERLAEQSLKVSKLEEKNLKNHVRFYQLLQKRAKLMMPAVEGILGAAKAQLEYMAQGQDLSVRYPIPTDGYDDPSGEPDAGQE